MRSSTRQKELLRGTFRGILMAAMSLTLATTAPEAAQAKSAPAAQKLISKAEGAFVARRFADALALYQKARRASKAPLLAYMVARCQEQLGRIEEAIASYQAYLKSGKDEAVRGRATAAIRLLRERLSRGTLVLQVTPFGSLVSLDGKILGKAPLPPQTVAPGEHTIKVTHSSEIHERKVTVPGGGTINHVVRLDIGQVEGSDEQGSFAPWQWVSLGVGIAVVVGGAAMVGLGESELSAISDSSGASPANPSPTTQKQAASDIDNWTTIRTAGFVLVGLGVAMAAAGVVLAALEPSDPESSTTIEGAGLVPIPRGAAMMLQGSF